MANPHISQSDCQITRWMSLATTFLLASLSEGTKSVYTKTMDNLRVFSEKNFPGVVWFPTSANILVLFIVSLLDAGQAPTTVLSALSAIAYFHKLYSLPDPTCHFIVKKIVLGASKLRPQCDLRAPITSAILLSLSNALLYVCDSSYERTMFNAMFSFMFHAFLRIGEVTESVNNLLLSQVKIKNSSIYVKFLKFKHYNGRPITIIVISSVTNCPVKAMSDYLSIRGSNPGPLFVFPCHKSIPGSFFTKRFNSCLARCSLDPTMYKPHSFRIGAATNAFSNGATTESIQQMGRWKSQAFKKYIRLDSIGSTVG